MPEIIQYNDSVKNVNEQNRTYCSSSKVKQYTDIVKEIREKNNKNMNYSIGEIQCIVNDILKVVNCYNRNCATPIVTIIEGFGIKAYVEKLSEGICGALFVNGTTKKIYGTNSVILVNTIDKLYYQRFIIANELACFLFEYLGSDSDKNNSIVFTDEYRQDNASLKNKWTKSRFVTEILMPERMFCKQYMIANQECSYMNSEERNAYLIMYLSKFFEVEKSLAKKRINEITDKE